MDINVTINLDPGADDAETVSIVIWEALNAYYNDVTVEASVPLPLLEACKHDVAEYTKQEFMTFCSECHDRLDI